MPIYNNKPFWGILNNNYTSTFRDAVNRIANDPMQLNTALSTLNNSGVNYVKDKGTFEKATSDYVVGPVHAYIKKQIELQNQNPIVPINNSIPEVQQNIPIQDYNGTYIDNMNREKPSTLSAYRDSIAINPNYGSKFEATYNIPNTEAYMKSRNIKQNNFKLKTIL